MALSTGEEPPSLPIAAAGAPLVTMEAKMMVATGRGDCKQLKDLLSREDSSTVVVVMASSNPTSTPKLDRSPSPVMNSRLLASVCSGSWKDLEALINGEHCQASSSNSRDGRSASQQQGSEDIEAFLKEPLLAGVTVGGDTALHAVATYGNFSMCPDIIFSRANKGDTGDGGEGNFLKIASIICAKARHLLLVQNKKGDTPLHCAARAGKLKMVSHLLSLAKVKVDGVDIVKALLKTQNNAKETALHDAVRVGNNNIVELLMEEEPELACFPKDGTSPLFLAILLENKIIAETLHSKSAGILSYSGPNGQNALHAAVLRGKELTDIMLKWNKYLTTQKDEKGSTPLHFAIGQPSECWQVLQANPDALYESDNDGMFPIHIAASVGAKWAIISFLEKSPSCAGLRDSKGRTFLHVAVEKRILDIVSYACKNLSISWILNMPDNDGNTALHLVVQSGSLRMFCSLFGNREVNLNLTNEEGQTPRDISRYNIPPGMYYNQNSEPIIFRALAFAGARYGCYRLDHFDENYFHQIEYDESEEIAKVKDSSQTLCIGSVLIAGMTFGATFAIPGGYIADDHTNGGTPTLARRYAFEAFIMSNTLAFIFSSMATIGLMFSGSPMFNSRSRKKHLTAAFYLVSVSITSLVAGFANGAYMVLAPVAHKTAVAVCALCSLVVLYRNLEFMMRYAVFIGPLCRRNGLIWALREPVCIIMGNLLVENWTLLVIFGWAAYARDHSIPKV